MGNQNKKFVLDGLLCFLVCLIFGLVINARTVSALSYAEVSGQQVLGDSTATAYPYPSGSLVKDGGAIYFISGTTKVPFSSYKAFIGLGYSLRNVVSGDLSNYAPSQNYVINTANAAHPWGSWLSYKGAVYYSFDQGIIGVPSSQVFLSNGGKWNMVVKANKYDLAIIKSSKSLPALTNGDSRIIGSANLQFNGAPQQPTASPVQPSPTPTAPVASATPVTYVPIPVLPAVVYSSSSASYYVSFNNPNTPIVYTFDWDDGTLVNSLSVNSAVHTYTLPGKYLLNISIVDHLSNTYSTTVPVTVVLPVTKIPTVPQLSIPSGIIIGAQATVSANASDPQSSPLTYIFSWGDGTPDTAGVTNSATHVYTSSDSFVVKVTVTNALGFSSSSSGYLYVAP